MDITTRVKVHCRVAYVRINKPVSFRDGATEKYSLTCIIDKEDQDTIDAINNAIYEAQRIGIDKKWDGSMPDDIKSPLRDGDADRPDDETYKGKYFISASTIQKPVVVDKQVHIVNDPRMVYSGCYCNVILEFYPFRSPAVDGIAAELGNIQFVKDGEPLGFQNRLNNEFEVIA